MRLDKLVEYLDAYLRIGEIEDAPSALNGLQVESAGSVERIAVAVDACQATIDAAVAMRADLLLVHHGLFWGGLETVTGRRWRRLRPLLAHNVAVYAAHIPLDLHPEVGNNAVLARQLGVERIEWFGDYHGHALGAAGTLELDRDELVNRVRRVLGVEPHVIAAGPERVARVGVITGGGGRMIRQAVEAGLDAFVTGEGQHHTHFDAEEYGINALFAGHYATETVGVKALATHLEQRFGLSWEFVDHPTGL